MGIICGIVLLMASVSALLNTEDVKKAALLSVQDDKCSRRFNIAPGSMVDVLYGALLSIERGLESMRLLIPEGKEGETDACAMHTSSMSATQEYYTVLSYLFPGRNNQLNVYAAANNSLCNYLRTKEDSRVSALAALIVSPLSCKNGELVHDVLCEFLSKPTEARLPPFTNTYLLSRETLMATFLYKYLADYKEYKDLIQQIAVRTAHSTAYNQFFVLPYDIKSIVDLATHSVFNRINAYPDIAFTEANTLCFKNILGRENMTCVDQNWTGVPHSDSLIAEQLRYKLLKLINFLLYDNTTNSYNTKHKRVMHISPELEAFYKKYTNTHGTTHEGWLAWRTLLQKYTMWDAKTYAIHVETWGVPCALLFRFIGMFYNVMHGSNNIVPNINVNCNLHCVDGIGNVQHSATTIINSEESGPHMCSDSTSGMDSNETSNESWVSIVSENESEYQKAVVLAFLDQLKMLIRQCNSDVEIGAILKGMSSLDKHNIEAGLEIHFGQPASHTVKVRVLNNELILDLSIYKKETENTAGKHRRLMESPPPAIPDAHGGYLLWLIERAKRSLSRRRSTEPLPAFKTPIELIATGIVPAADPLQQEAILQSLEHSMEKDHQFEELYYTVFFYFLTGYISVNEGIVMHTLKSVQIMRELYLAIPVNAPHLWRIAIDMEPDSSKQNTMREAYEKSISDLTGPVALAYAYTVGVQVRQGTVQEKVQGDYLKIRYLLRGILICLKLKHYHLMLNYLEEIDAALLFKLVTKENEGRKVNELNWISITAQHIVLLHTLASDKRKSMDCSYTGATSPFTARQQKALILLAIGLSPINKAVAEGLINVVDTDHLPILLAALFLNPVLCNALFVSIEEALQFLQILKQLRELYYRSILFPPSHDPCNCVTLLDISIILQDPSRATNNTKGQSQDRPFVVIERALGVYLMSFIFSPRWNAQEELHKYIEVPNYKLEAWNPLFTHCGANNKENLINGLHTLFYIVSNMMPANSMANYVCRKRLELKYISDILYALHYLENQMRATYYPEQVHGVITGQDNEDTGSTINLNIEELGRGEEE